LNFWDSSAIVPALSRQVASATVKDLLREDDEITVWWGTWIECAVAISRLKHEEKLDEESEERARARLDRLADGWVEIEPADDLRLLASLVSKDHPLKTADALQLAAALRWCEGDTANAAFVCLDDRLRRAARDEGFQVLPGEEE
jgi:predicted nucleic acid-binding protein